MIMGDWIEILQEFNEIAGDTWKITLNRMLRGKTGNVERDLLKAFKKFTIYVKHMLVEENAAELEELERVLHNDILYHLLMQYEEEKVFLINCYIEKLEFLYLNGEYEKGDCLIEGIFDNIIVRTNPAFLKQYALYGIENEGDLLNLGNAIDSIVMEAVKQRFNGQALEEYLIYKFPSSEEMINKIRDQYEKNYSELRERYATELREVQRQES